MRERWYYYYLYVKVLSDDFRRQHFRNHWIWKKLNYCLFISLAIIILFCLVCICWFVYFWTAPWSQVGAMSIQARQIRIGNTTFCIRLFPDLLDPRLYTDGHITNLLHVLLTILETSGCEVSCHVNYVIQKYVASWPCYIDHRLDIYWTDSWW